LHAFSFSSRVILSEREGSHKIRARLRTLRGPSPSARLGM